MSMLNTIYCVQHF